MDTPAFDLKLLHNGQLCSAVTLKAAEFVQTPQLPSSGRFAMTFTFVSTAAGLPVAAQVGVAKVCSGKVLSTIRLQDDGFLLGERNRKLRTHFRTGDRVTVCMDVSVRETSFFINDVFLFASPWEEDEEPPHTGFAFQAWSRPPRGQQICITAVPAVWQPTPPVAAWPR
eukprot:EC724697.1.p1 GENE.EC724697.1~~EC724697.1.p1  ORF type:complete len:190 (+),score=18.76 EC724697.1:64-570(+)